MIEHHEKIWWQDSWIHGWRREAGRLTFFVEVHLMKDHPAFEPFDKKKYFACYKTALLRVSGLEAIRGLPQDSHSLTWDEEMEEFEDVGEIQVFDLDPSGRALHIETGNAPRCPYPDFDLWIEFGAIELVFEDLERPFRSGTSA
ncbi:MAG TPA: hypothetical protein EYH07_17815 [Kiloniellaceae bacterium]|nr:hypothetical protein [Kiloniellaceae bacterium]HIP80301.1 hypothetical protein [Kiloniellaceae bacterium]